MAVVNNPGTPEPKDKAPRVHAPSKSSGVSGDHRSGVDTQVEQGAAPTNKSYGPGPVAVYVAPDVALPPIRLAINRWNTALNKSVFKLTKSRVEADVVVALKDASKGGGVAVDTGQEGIYRSTGKGLVTLDPTFFTPEAYQQVLTERGVPEQNAVALSGNIMHELGHTIGLAHPGEPGTQNEYGPGNPNAGLMGGWSLTQNEIDTVNRLRDQQPVRNQQVREPVGYEAVKLPGQDINPRLRGLAGIVIPDNPDQQKPPSQDPPSGNPPASSPPSSSSSSSTPSAPPVDPRVAQLESLFRSAYIQLWGEPPTEAYIKQAAQHGMNVTEFVHHERMKDAFQFTKTYKDEAKGLYAALRQMGAV